jgi:hypothetical protein
VPGLFDEEVSMPTPFSNDKRGDQDDQQLVVIWLTVITMVLVLAIAGFVGVIF